MEIFGIGGPELALIIIIALILLGPKDMEKAGKTIGKFLRDTVTSDSWKLFQQTAREIRTLPNRLMREANEDLNTIGNELKSTINVTEYRQSQQPTGVKPVELPSPTISGPVIEDKPAPASGDAPETKSEDNQGTNA